MRADPRVTAPTCGSPHIGVSYILAKAPRPSTAKTPPRGIHHEMSVRLDDSSAAMDHGARRPTDASGARRRLLPCWEVEARDRTNESSPR